MGYGPSRIQATLPDLDTVGRKLRTSSMPYLYDIAEGNIANHFAVNKFGHNPTVGAALESVWSGSVDYTFSSAAAAYYISSSAAGDGQVIEVQGLDANWELQVINVTLQGLTKTRIGTTETFIRAFRAKNTGTTNNAGNVWIYEDDTLTDGVPDTDSKKRAMIAAGENQTLMAIWSVPNTSSTAYLTSFYASTSIVKATEVRLYVRPFGGVFQVKKVISINGGTGQISYDIPLVIAAKSDVQIRAKAAGGGGEVSAGFDLWYEE